MALKPRLDVRQTQQLHMSPQLQQAIQLLQMSGAELQQFVDAEIERNPLLERQDRAQDDADSGPSKAEDRLSFQTDFDGKCGLVAPPSGKSDPAELIEGQPTLQALLREQVPMITSDPHIERLALYLVDELDDDGYLRTPLFDIAERLGLPTRDVDEALVVVQSCEPTGVGARNLGECFTLQLAEKRALTPKMATFLAHIEMLGGKKDEKFWADHGIDEATYTDLLAQIRGLNAAPGKKYDQGFTQYAVPDVAVTRDNLGGWKVDLIASTLPAITVNRDLATSASKDGKDAAEFISRCSSRANWLRRSLKQRSDTILKVAAEIVRVQEPFFSQGIAHLNPLTMRDVADKLDLHESTVSRVTTSKYLTCERGNFELKFFFAQALPSLTGAQAQSSASVQDKIRKLIDAEDPHSVLSDDKIVKKLNEIGIDIARRTVSKYREGMDIPSSSQRRRFKSNLDKIRT